jgi:nitroimidazol reductase NimA-like FMN-containing flavoprotein (pyridoxamine 5'-phosphate oxidase superfamily)
MGIALAEDELWRFIDAAPTAIVTTLRRDGWPVSLPVWFAVLDHRIYLKTYRRMRKVARIARDARASFVVEEGRVWTQLRAVSLSATAEVLPPGPETDAGRRALRAKYPSEIDVPMDRLPEASRAFYAGSEDVIVKLTPVGRSLSWDNSRLRLLADEGHRGPVDA